MNGEERYKGWLKAVKIDHNAISDVPKELWTNELCLEAVKKNYAALKYLSKEYLTKEICFAANKQSPSAIEYVHKDLQQLYADYFYSFLTLKNIFNSAKDKIYKLFDESDYVSKIKPIIKDYNIEYNCNFNIFSSISETYYKENMHSDIITLILDPATEKIGNIKNLELFVKLLNKIKPELKITIGDGIAVEREKGRIDILIHDSKNAIIIENKINFAKDEKDQIGRYYNKTIKRGLVVKAIVYLTLSPEKKLDINYSIKDLKLREKITDIIIPLPALNKKNEINFADDFIGKCINNFSTDKNIENITIAKVYYSEYGELLKSLGGSVMTMDLDRKTLMEIYANKEKLESFNMFGALWDKKEKLFNDMFRELLKENGNDFHEHPDDPKYNLYFKINDNISLLYYSNKKEKYFGFTSSPKGKKLSKNLQDKLKILLENKKLKDIFIKEPTGSDEWWVWKRVDINKIGDPKNLITNFNILKEILNQKKGILEMD